MSRATEYWPFGGGLDLVTPAKQIANGRAIAGQNFEPWINGGYRRIKGFERYDGRPQPGDATWERLELDAVGDATAGRYIRSGTDYYGYVISVDETNNYVYAVTIDGTPEVDQVITAVHTPFLHIDPDYYRIHGSFMGVTDGVRQRIEKREASAFDEGAKATSLQSVTIDGTEAFAYTVTVKDLGGGTPRIGFLVRTATATEFVALYWKSTTFFDDTGTTTVSSYTANDELTFVWSQGDIWLAKNGVWEDGDGDALTGSVISTSFSDGDEVYVYAEHESGASGQLDLDYDWFNLEGDWPTWQADTAVGTIAAIVNEGAQSTSDKADLRNSAADWLRGQIGQVPPKTQVGGLWQIGDRVYAIAPYLNAQALTYYDEIYKATTVGWDHTQMEYAHTVYFDAGSVLPEVGDTLTGATSGATGTIHKIIVHIGAWGTADAAGYFALTGVTGAYDDNENLQVSAVTQAVAASDSEQFVPDPYGTYNFRDYNFFGGADSYATYAAGGTGPAFEIDGNDVVTPILMDLTLGDAPEENKPFLVEAHGGRLWLAFANGSLQYSIAGDPFTFNGFLGAAEYGMGDEITGLASVTGDVLAAYTRRGTYGFYATGVADPPYQKRTITDRAGAILYSVQHLDTVYAVDDSGVVALNRVESFGDFAAGTVSELIQPLVYAKKELLVGSYYIRESNQIRWLFSDGTGIIGRFRQNGSAEFMILDYGITPYVASSCQTDAGTPAYWFAGSETVPTWNCEEAMDCFLENTEKYYAYTAEVGSSFDGRNIAAWVRLNYNHNKSPSVRKRYRLADVDLETQGYIELDMAQEMDYSDTETRSWVWSDESEGGGARWDDMQWDEFFWDGEIIDTMRFELLGTGKNLSLIFSSNTDKASEFVLQGATLQYDPRRVQR